MSVVPKDVVPEEIIPIALKLCHPRQCRLGSICAAKLVRFSLHLLGQGIDIKKYNVHGIRMKLLVQCFKRLLMAVAHLSL